MEEGKLAYRVRTAAASDAAALRDAIGATLAHPDPQSRRGSFSGAAARGDILLLEHFDRAAHDWQIAAFVECHMRVDDNLSIRDVGTPGEQPQIGAVRYLLDQAFNSFRPVEAQVKIRRDAGTWLELFRSIAGFYLEGEEYRRPHYWTIWRWDRQHAQESAQQGQRAAGQATGQRPRPLAPPPGNAPTTASRDPRLAGPPPGGPQRGPRPDGIGGNLPQRGPRPDGIGGNLPPRGPRPGGTGGSSPQAGARPGGPNGGRPPQPGARPNGPTGPARPLGPAPRRPNGRSRGPANPR